LNQTWLTNHLYSQDVERAKEIAVEKALAEQKTEMEATMAALQEDKAKSQKDLTIQLNKVRKELKDNKQNQVKEKIQADKNLTIAKADLKAQIEREKDNDGRQEAVIQVLKRNLNTFKEPAWSYEKNSKRRGDAPQYEFPKTDFTENTFTIENLGKPLPPESLQAYEKLYLAEKPETFGECKEKENRGCWTHTRRRKIEDVNELAKADCRLFAKYYWVPTPQFLSNGSKPFMWHGKVFPADEGDVAEVFMRPDDWKPAEADKFDNMESGRWDIESTLQCSQPKKSKKKKTDDPPDAEEEESSLLQDEQPQDEEVEKVPLTEKEQKEADKKARKATKARNLKFTTKSKAGKKSIYKVFL